MWMGQTGPRWTPESNAEKAAVWDQVDRLLNDPSFNKSRRYPSLLRFIVSRTLNGQSDSLKERILGIEIFGRSSDYDSTQDPIVRVTVTEIRKRILRYYDNPQHQNELRLFLPAGSYVPYFEPPPEQLGDRGVTPALPAGEVVEDRKPPPASQTSDSSADPLLPGNRGRRFLLGISITVAAASLIAAIVFLLHVRRPDALTAFWSPAFRSSSPVLICMADQSSPVSALMDAANPKLANDGSAQSGNPYTSSNNVPPVVDLIGMLAAHGRAYTVQPQSTTTFSNLGNGPVILLGAYNNYWTLKLTSPLRFHFANDSEMSSQWIEDSQSPSKKEWQIGTKGPLLFGKDYAIIARFVPPHTRQTTFVVAGLGHAGVVEGVKFLLSAQRMSELDRLAPSGWPDRNIEIVIETEVVNGNAGPPLVDAVYTW